MQSGEPISTPLRHNGDCPLTPLAILLMKMNLKETMVMPTLALTTRRLNLSRIVAGWRR